MSRRDKQADLRKRMVEARSKLLSSRSPQQQPDDGRVEVQLAGQKRPAPKTAGAGSSILRKSKYNTSAHDAPRVMVAKAEDLPHQKSGDEVNTPASAAPTPAAMLECEADERRKKKKKRKKKEKKRVADQHEQEEITQQQRQNGQGDGGDNMEQAFAEFNALLEADETNAMPAMPPQPSVTSVDETKAKVKKKKKKRKEKDVYDDNDATNNLAQASYEARVARLTLLTKTKKKEQREAGDELGDKDFYDPGLAFQEDEETQAVAQDSPMGDGGEGSKQTNNSHLAKALRERIEKTRKLTRSTLTKEEEEPSDVQDGSWF
ncbi:hypothetical protein THAOC_13027 [Thalassiosira oceanica]|uniref:Uncharacterized protein n=1 Tax=Thalassiosira oceanica TaxID=159749 RepID=K0SYK0_THAOC|nr:hypothetical protein THAOC_13027 [Thalassiosira oceanica]|eukprot:EJK66071.1 hypothetical protein THAOC_13027 [Thalassiosira oceanica]